MRVPTSSPPACARCSRNAASGPSAKGFTATASTMPTSSISPSRSTSTKGPARRRGSASPSSPNTARPSRSIPLRRPTASRTPARSRASCSACHGPTCSPASVAATRAAASTCPRPADGRLPTPKRAATSSSSISAATSTRGSSSTIASPACSWGAWPRGSASSTCSPIPVRLPCTLPAGTRAPRLRSTCRRPISTGPAATWP